MSRSAQGMGASAGERACLGAPAPRAPAASPIKRYFKDLTEVEDCRAQCMYDPECEASHCALAQPVLAAYP